MSGSLLKDENYCLAAFFLQLYCLLRCSLLFRHSAPSDSLRAHGLQPARLPGLWDSPGKNTGVGCHFLLQGIFSTQGLSPGLLHCRQILSRLGHKYSGVKKTFSNTSRNLSSVLALKQTGSIL